MLRLIATHDPLLSDAYIRILGLEKKDSTPLGDVYQKGGWILLMLTHPLSSQIGETLAEIFLPERLYLPLIGESIDVIHEIGDIIVPNVFLSYNPALEKTEITKENRDSFATGARFLDVFDEQKDYYVEDYGLSVGGIVVGGVPSSHDDDLLGKLMLAYEADIYMSTSLLSAVDIAESNDVTTLIMAGIVRGKAHPKYTKEDPYILVARNMISTMKLMEEE